MEKEFLPYELAVKLKALGYDEEGLGTYSVSGQVLPLKPYTTESKAILFSQAFRWFREKYGLFIQPNRTIDSEGTWYYFSISSKRTDVCEGSFVYEEAELACLEKLIELTFKSK